MSSYKTSIVIDNKTRNSLKKIGRKEQTYDDIIGELINNRKEVIEKNKAVTPVEEYNDLKHSGDERIFSDSISYSVFSDLCYCGHEKDHHCNLRRCDANNCQCRKFLP